MTEIFALMSLWEFFAACVIAFVAGFVKGSIGFAMPLILVSGLTLFLDPPLALAGLIVPTVVSNLWQALRHGLGAAWEVVKTFRRYILIVCVMIVIAAQLVTRVAPETFYLALGIPVVVLSLIQILGVRIRIPQDRRAVADWGVGVLAGGMGGFSGTWGPPTVLYLMALDTPKARSILAQGVVYGLGSLSLVAGHIQSGVLSWVTVPFSAALLVPALAGQALGFRMGDRLNPEVFRRATLIVLVISGANLVRRGLFG